MKNYRKLKPRFKRFAEAIVEGLTQTDAAKLIKPNARSPKRLGYKLRHTPKIAAAIEELEAMAMEEAGITLPGVLLRMNEIANRCMQAEQVRDRKGEPIEGAYTFDSAGANRALENLAKYGLRIPERTEITGVDGGPIAYKSANDLTDEELAAIAAGRPSKADNSGGSSSTPAESA